MTSWMLPPSKLQLSGLQGIHQHQTSPLRGEFKSPSDYSDLSADTVATTRPVAQVLWVIVALRREDLTQQQLEHQRALDRSWAEAQRGLADPAFRAYLDASLRWLDAGEPAPLLTREEFLAQTALPTE